MSLSIGQSSQPGGGRRWRWRLWLQGNTEDLDAVERVEYELHPTFPDPVRSTTDRASAFALEGTAWGEFLVHATAYLKDGASLSLQHWLDLDASAPTKEAPMRGGGRRGSDPTVFISSSIADREVAARMKSALARLGVRAVLPDDLPLGAEWKSALQSAIDSADLGIALVSEETGPWMAQEIGEIRDHHKPVIPVMIGDVGQVPEQLRDMQAVHLGFDENADAVAQQIANIVPQRK